MKVYDWLLKVILGSYRYIFRPNLTRVRCLVFRKNQVLLVQHMGSSSDWTIPGGGLKANEEPADTARRELKEELKLNLKDITPLEEITVQEHNLSMNVKLVVVNASSKKLHLQRTEIRKADWFELDALPEGLTPLAQKALTMIDKNTQKNYSADHLKAKITN